MVDEVRWAALVPGMEKGRDDLDEWLMAEPKPDEPLSPLREALGLTG